MSGDVQPRKRKDKKRKRDAFDRKSEGEVTFSRQQSVQDDDESSHGVHITKMAGDDVHLHVHEDHGTGGHWCAKVFFFGLLVVLLGLVGLIILENRGISDLDTPLSESRFSNYFDGWVEEHREEHDDHDPVAASIEDHDDHDEPFEEEEDHSEVSDDDDHDDHDEDEDDQDDHDEDDDDEEEDDQNVTEEDDQQTKENDDDEDEQTKENDDDDDDDDQDDEDDDNGTKENNDDDDDDEDENLTKTIENEDDDDDDNNTAEDNDNDDDGDDNEDNTNENTIEASQEDNDDDNDNDDNDNNDNDDNDDDDDNDNNDNDNDDDSADVEEPIKPVYTRPTHHSAKSKQSNADDDDDNDDDDDPFDEEDDDGTFESLENVVVDNDAEELLLLQEKARQQAAEASKNDPPSTEDDDEDQTAEKSSSWASLAAKIIVGVALPLVARLVLIRKNPNTNEEPSPEILMKRRLTIANAEDTFPDDETETPLLEDEYSEEEIEIEEEIEYVEEEEEIEVDESGDVIKTMGRTYAPESFEQLNAMYKSKDYDIETPPPKPQTQHAQTQERKVELDEIEQNYNKTQPITPSTTQASKKAPAIFNAPPPPPPLVQQLPTTSAYENLPSARPPINPSAASPAEDSPKTKQDKLVYPPDDDDIEYDDEDDYSGEEEEEDDEDDLLDDDDDVSDVDDAELMSRLEAKYGRLPANEFESDEDPDDPTWTQIKPKQPSAGGGPQSNDDDDDDEDDLFEQELRRANEEMMRENYPAALKVFSLLSQKFPDKPQAFLGKAKSLDHLSERQRSNQLLGEALEAYKRYLAFGDVIENATEYRTAAERCIERMRFMGNDMQAVPIHEQLIERFSDEPNPRNQLAVTFLLINRLSDAKTILKETLSRWPLDGFAQVHYGFVLKQHDNDYENAIKYLKYGIDSKAAGTQDGRFFSNLGEALQRLGRQSEALEVYQHGADLQLFASVYQRSLYNEPKLRAQPFWTKEESTYEKFLHKLEQNWLAIRDEGLSVLSRSGYFMDEAENLRDSGDWKQFELYARGQRNERNCQKAPITCSLIAEFRAASGCRRGQVKFSVMHPGTHVWPHCGPTNCRLRAHLGLIVPAGTRLRVADEERTWIEGQFLLFDDSFEHEVWHNGNSLRLVLIVDIWHPDLSEQRRRSITPI